MTDPLIGRTLRGGEYELKEVIAYGGQATVYRAYARQLDTDVAVKVLNQNLAADIDFRERFHDEARILAKLHHKNLVDVKCYDEDDELVYIVMRLVPGGTLKDRLQALGGSLGLTDAGRTIGQIAEALQHAHDNGVLHLDIKPANVLLGQADWPLVTDLGLTRAIQRDHTSAGHSRVAGTPAYMSPEQCRGAAIDERSDQYSLAVTAYELLTGRQPFQAKTTEALLQKQIEAPPPRPREINPGLPGPIEEVLLRGLAKEPGDRFPRIADFGQALAEAVERTRGVSLEAKLAAAATAPNLLAILALVLAAPFMLAILPVGNVLGRLPLAWPFQLLLAGSIAALLLGMRWHLIGLVGRGVGGSLATLEHLSRQQVMLGTGTDGPLHVRAWRNTAIASVEGMINLLYVLATYRLVGVPALAVARSFLDPAAYQLVDAISLVVVGGVILGIIAGILRGAGPVPAAVVLALGWAAAITLPTFEVDLSSAKTLGLAAQLVVAAGLLLLLGAQRRSASEALGRLASGTLGRLLTEGRPGITPEQSAASARQIERLTCGVLDFCYLLLGYALLRTPLVDLLSPFTTPLAAAIVATGVACVIWLVLIVRLHWIAGIVGVVLGAVLGAPVLVSLPVLDTGLIHATWPATIASWGAAGALLLLLAVLRGPTQMIGRTALGARLDRGLLGASAASTEEQSAQRSGALGGVAGAFIDICFLLIGYWVIGVPISNALIRITHQPAVGSVVLMCVLAIALGLILAPSRRAASTLAQTGGAQWRGRSRAFTVVALVAGAMLIALGGAAPAAVAGPTVLSPAAFTPELARLTPRVIVDRDTWLPWSPLPEQATYNLALSCSDGRSIGQFREVYEPLSASPIPAGNVGSLGLTDVGCDDWRWLYQARRHAAGLTDASSLSWEWLHVQATVHDDRSADVVETQRVFFSAGDHYGVNWNLGAPGAAQLSNVEVFSESGSTAAKDVQLAQISGQQRVTWSIPKVVGPAEQTFTIRYHLTPGASADGQQVFEHLIASPERSEPIWQASVEVRLPSTVNQQSLQLLSNGPAARTGVAPDRSAWFEASDLPGNQAFTVIVKAPSIPPLTPEPTATPTQLVSAVTGSPTSVMAASATDSPPVEVAGGVVTQSAATLMPGVETTPPTETPPPTVEPSSNPEGTVTPGTTDAPPLAGTATPSAGGDGLSGPAVTPEATVASTPTTTPSPTSTAMPTITAAGTETTLTPAATASATSSSIVTSTPTSMRTASRTPMGTPTASVTPTITPTRAASHGSGGSSDTTPPVITHTVSPSPNALGWNHSPVTITWTISNPVSGIDTATGCAPTTLATATTGTTLTCHATSLAGNSASDSVLVKLDTTPPMLDTTLTPGPRSAGQSVEIGVLASKDLAAPPVVTASGSCVATAGVPMTLVGTTLPPTYVGTYTVPAGTTDCSVAVSAAAFDIAGNASVGGNAELGVDRTPPTLAVNAAPRLARAGSSVSIDVLSNETMAAPPVVTVTGNCLSGSPIVLSVTPAGQSDRYLAAFDVPAGSTDCSADIVAVGSDRAGNQGSGNTRLAIDRTPPRLNASVSPAIGRAGASIGITVAASEVLNGAPSVSISGSCVPDAAVSMALNGSVFLGTYTVPAGSIDCTPAVQATATDVAGNPSSGGQTTFGIDRTPPALRITVAPNPVLPAGSGTVTVDSTENLGSAPTVTLAAAGGCLPQDIHVSMSPIGQAKSYSGTFSVPDINGNCAAVVVANGEDLAHNAGTGRTSLEIAQAMQKLSISVNSPVAGSGEVVSGPGVKCVAGSKDSCSITVPRNQTVTLSAQPGNLVGFENWKGSDVCSGADSTCKVVMDKDHAEVANFIRRNTSPLGTPTVPTAIVASLVSSASPTLPSRSAALGSGVVAASPTASVSVLDTPTAAPTAPVVGTSAVPSATSAPSHGPSRSPAVSPAPTMPSASGGAAPAAVPL